MTQSFQQNSTQMSLACLLPHGPSCPKDVRNCDSSDVYTFKWESHKEQEGFFNLLTHVQGARIDEQRCSIQIVHSKGDQDRRNSTPVTPPPEMNHLMDMLAQSQSRRLDDQRAEFTQSPSFPDTMPTRRVSQDNGGLKEAEVPIVPDDYFSFINQVHSRHLGKHLKNPGGRK
ncbi:Purkinje cell protein 2 homolog isoform X3 [Hyla sarda]|uniref:Purkinje cell protein 2 homolog isoform X3 n=1 Tax=Hyla sarda TaxID=327740 RepID=UPI0024C3FA8F|nr:Purkinje cell protein 2 homolog isoform X3 [Hyla sarda]